MEEIHSTHYPHTPHYHPCHTTIHMKLLHLCTRSSLFVVLFSFFLFFLSLLSWFVLSFLSFFFLLLLHKTRLCALALSQGEARAGWHYQLVKRRPVNVSFHR